MNDVTNNAEQRAVLVKDENKPEEDEEELMILVMRLKRTFNNTSINCCTCPILKVAEEDPEEKMLKLVVRLKRVFRNVLDEEDKKTHMMKHL